MTQQPPSTAVAKLECQVPVLLSSLFLRFSHGWAPLHTHNTHHPLVKKRCTIFNPFSQLTVGRKEGEPGEKKEYNNNK